jgi:hypothetical protein
LARIAEQAVREKTMSSLICSDGTPYVVPEEFVLEKLERLTAAMKATTEAEVYAAFGLKAPTINTKRSKRH